MIKNLTTSREGDNISDVNRYYALDGLRGLAAFSVLLSHVLWATPQFSDAVQLENTGEAGLLVYLLTYTPLHLVWLAHEAVLVFFVLSGFVLSLGFLRRKRSYLPYYPSRLVRLLVPAWAALLVSWVFVWLLYPPSGSTGAWLLNTQIGLDLSVRAFDNFWLVTDTPRILPPLWSLQWELIFSLLLPVYVLVGRWVVGLLRSVFVFVVSIVIHVVGVYFQIESAEYLPVFMLGIVIAVNLEAIVAWTTGRRALWIGVLSLFALSAQWYPRGFSDSIIFVGAGRIISLLGCVGVVVAAMTWSSFSSMLSGVKIISWLGSRSFSLYLVHFPLVVGIAFLTNGENGWLTLGLGVPASLLCAEIFYRLVEAPTTDLSRRMRKRLTAARTKAVSNPA